MYTIPVTQTVCIATRAQGRRRSSSIAAAPIPIQTTIRIIVNSVM